MFIFVCLRERDLMQTVIFLQSIFLPSIVSSLSCNSIAMDRILCISLFALVRMIEFLAFDMATTPRLQVPALERRYG